MLKYLIQLFKKPGTTALQNAINNGAFLADVRTPQEFAGDSIKGSVNIPLDKVQSRLQEFKNKTAIIVFCRSGNRSRLAKAILTRNGFTNVINGGSLQNVKSIVNN